VVKAWIIEIGSHRGKASGGALIQTMFGHKTILTVTALPIIHTNAFKGHLRIQDSQHIDEEGSSRKKDRQ